MRHTNSLALHGLVTFALLGALPLAAAEREGDSKPSGKELFTREWMAADARSAGGDGLGPMFNESSCVACHTLGGIGGGGPESKNVQILSVVG